MALQKAHEILINATSADWGARCNQAITIISDDIPEDFKELFERYNTVNSTQTPTRLFTYLIGHEDAKQADVDKKMNCQNPGQGLMKKKNINNVLNLNSNV